MPPLAQALKQFLLGKGLRGAQLAERARKARLFAGGSVPTREALGKAEFLRHIETAPGASQGYYRRFGLEPETAGGRTKEFLKDLMIGRHGLDVLRARYHLGGLLGKGGLLRGELAWSPQVVEAFRNIRHSGITPQRAWELTRAAPMDLMNKAFIVGFPAYGIGSALLGPVDPRLSRGQLVGRELGTAGAWALGGPLGLLGYLPASMLGEAAGKSFGGLIDPQSELQKRREMLADMHDIRMPMTTSQRGGIGASLLRAGMLPEE